MKRFSRHREDTRSSDSIRRTYVFYVILVGLLLSGPVRAQSLSPRVKSLLGKMTIEEKVGEMTQLTLQTLAAERGTPGTPFRLDPALLHEAVANRHVGAFLNVYDMALTPTEWVSLIDVIQNEAEKTRLGIPIIYGIDAVHGNNYLMGGTVFPQAIGMAATWSTSLMAAAGEITARETRAVGITWNFAPVLDLGRQPLWSRFFETFGEDVHLATTMGSATIRQQQAMDKDGHVRIALTGKHYAGYSMPLSGKDRTPAWIPERMMREYYMPPFVRAVEDGVQTVMVNSGEVNGIPGHINHWLLTDVLRGELGFDGIVDTDWDDIAKLHSAHHVATSYSDALAMAIDAGIDMVMVPYDYLFTDTMLELVETGRISEERIDLSVGRILTVKERLGLFDSARPIPADVSQIGSATSYDVTLEAARESMTLLKNRDEILPIDAESTVMVAGPAARSLPMMHGAWTYTWQGTDEKAYPANIQTLEGELSRRFEAINVMPWDNHSNPDRTRAMALASDVVVLALGEEPAVEQVGNTQSLEFPADQVALVRSIADTGARIIIVLFQARPRLIREIEPLADAILLAYEPGPAGAQAVSDVLDGSVNPSGRLPFTYPRYSGTIIPYDHKFSEETDAAFGNNPLNPQYPFGYGLSYTTFDYSDLSVTPEASTEDALPEVRITVKNTGSRTGKEVVQLFVTDLYASITPSVKRLRAFRKIELEPGQVREITFQLSSEDVSFVGVDSLPTTEPGTFWVSIGDQKAVYELRK